ncbi:MAG: peptidase carboxypeptidase [Candidatus Saccharibacteria bacterium]|nr:peptidase carboxypeptidase [Candidatus Saccharibacteria bacterium]
MQLKQTLFVLINKLRALPKRYTLPVSALVISGVLYVVVFVMEKPVVFSYAGQTCAKRLTLFPGAHTTSESAGYRAQPAQLVQIGSWPIAARSVCFTPLTAPQAGTVKVSVAPFGGSFARQTFALTVPSPVSADISNLSKPVPVSRPLIIKLSGVDDIFSYVLKIDGKMTDCISIEGGLSCGIEKMGLAQSHAYKADLVRYFNKKIVTTVATKDIQTLSATTLTDSSIKQTETVYAKPIEVTLAFDKKLVNISSELYKVEGDVRAKAPTTVMMTETGAKVMFSEQLARSSTYQLVVNKVEASDGSGLAEPYTLAFTTSGGPKVTSVNYGSAGVPIGATVIVTFDQPLSDKQDVSKFVGLSGGATLVRKQGNQLFVSVASAPKCGDFTIKITGDLQSQYDIAGNSTWNYTGRTMCYTIGTIGTSSQGRAINAYYFGSGTTTVMYTGAIHGSEGSTKSLMDRWIQELDAKARNIPAHITVVVVPTINPDGIVKGSRTNARNVDLNRNFATGDWQKDITTVGNQPFPEGGGESAMSEPETKAIAALAQRLRPKVILSYHSIGGMVAANQAGNSTALAATYAQLSGYRNVTGQSDTTFEYSVTGTADDWYAQAIGVPSILIELGSHTYHQFERNQTAMWAMINS